MGGSLGKVGSFSPVLSLPHVIGQVRYGRGRKGKHKCWRQSLDHDEHNVSSTMFRIVYVLLNVATTQTFDAYASSAALLQLENRH